MDRSGIGRGKDDLARLDDRRGRPPALLRRDAADVPAAADDATAPDDARWQSALGELFALLCAVAIRVPA